MHKPAFALTLALILLGCGGSEKADDSPGGTMAGTSSRAGSSADAGTNASGGTSSVVGGAGGSGSGGASGSAGTAGGGGASGAGRGSSMDGGVAPSTLPATETEACVEYVIAQCGRNQGCRGYPDDRDTCESWTGQCPDVVFSDGSARTIANLAACTEEWRVFPCDRLLRGFTPDCAIPGTRMPGEACTFGIQCTSTDCDRSAMGDCGRCTTLAEPGGACTDTDVTCPKGYACVASICEPRELPAEPPPEPDAGLQPIGIPIGSPCEPGQTCAERGWCTDHDGDGTNICEPLPTLGEPCPTPILSCGDDSECVYYENATEPYVCSEGADVGQPCEVDAFVQRPVHCKAPAFCDATDTCRAPARVGEACADDNPCADGLRCVCDDDECTSSSCRLDRISEIGESCAIPGESCRSWATCDGATCIVNGPQDLFESACGP